MYLVYSLQLLSKCESKIEIEIEIVNAIIDHYKNLYKTLCHKSKAFVKKFEDLVPTTLELPEKAQACDKPIKALKEKLEQKRNKKLANIETHVTRGKKYVSKKKEPKQQHLNSRRQNNPQLPKQPPQLTRRDSAPATHPNNIPIHQPRHVPFEIPPRTRTEDHNTGRNRNTIIELITRTIQNMITQMSLYFHQPHFPMRNFHY